MLTYNGRGDNASVTIAVIGDNRNRILTIDLKKAPFLLNFPEQNHPTGIAIQVQDGQVPNVILGAEAVLTITYPQPLEARKAEGFSPSSSFQVFFMYQGSS